MTKKLVMIKKGLIVLAAAGFLGFLYPELCMLEETCRVVYYNADEEMESISVPRGSELYYQLLQAEPEEIKIKSKLWETLVAYFEKDKEK